MADKIFFRNRNQLILWMNEMKGQISDGFWENARPHDHWKVMVNAEVGISEDPSISFAPYRSYNFANKELLEIVKDRMLFFVRLGIAYPQIPIERLRDYEDVEMVIRAAATEHDGDFWKKRLDRMRKDVGATNNDELKNKIASVIAQRVFSVVSTASYSEKDLLKDLKDMSNLVNRKLPMRASAVHETPAPAPAPAPAQEEDEPTLGKDTVKRILEIGEITRKDWHEPDEQDVSAKITGTHMDNAMGNDPTSNEFVIAIKGHPDGKPTYVNLSSLLADFCEAWRLSDIYDTVQKKNPPCPNCKNVLLESVKTNPPGGLFCPSCCKSFHPNPSKYHGKMKWKKMGDDGHWLSYKESEKIPSYSAWVVSGKEYLLVIRKYPFTSDKDIMHEETYQNEEDAIKDLYAWSPGV